MAKLLEYMLFDMTVWEYAACYLALLPWSVYAWMLVFRHRDQT